MAMTAPSTDTSGLTRGQLLQRGLAAGVAVGATGVLADAAPAVAQPTKLQRLRDALGDPTGIHSFRARVPRRQVAALRRLLADTRWPSMELVADRS
jgi:hypothetical protein